MAKKLTAAQLETLAPLAPNMAKAIVVGSLQYPGENTLETLRKTWADLTGTTYPWREGCPDCIIGLLRDLGQVYFQQTGIDPQSLCPKKVYYYNERNDRLETTPPTKVGSAASAASETPKPKTAPKKTTTAPKAAKTAKK